LHGTQFLRKKSRTVGVILELLSLKMTMTPKLIPDSTHLYICKKIQILTQI
jgi:hypothetical protein